MNLNTLFAFLFPCLVSASYSVKDDVLFSMKFNHFDPLKVSTSNYVPIITKDKEKYYCKLPTEVKGSKNSAPIYNYDGPNELELLKPLFKSKKCSVKLEPYWAYEVCHLKYIRQFHGHHEDSNAQQYMLGHYAPYNNLLDIRMQGLETIALEGQEFPYFQMNYTGGNVCEITGGKRSVNLLYICNEGFTAEIYQVTELESCKYQVIILTKLLCAHPKYQVRVDFINDLTCFTDNSDGPMPKSWIDFQQAREDLHQGRFSTNLEALFSNAEMPNLKVEAKRDKGGIVYRIKMTNEDNKREADIVKAMIDGIKSKLEVGEIDTTEMDDMIESAQKANDMLRKVFIGEMNGEEYDEATARTHPRPEELGGEPQDYKGYTALSVMRSDELRDFLRGSGTVSKCFVSGYGWWRQMVCFRHRIIQYHDNDDGTKIEILLGKWNFEKHLQAYQENINERQNSAIQLFHYYTDGDICEATGKPRQTVLKLTCDPMADMMHQIFVEAEICHYLFELKAAALCPIIAASNKETGEISLGAI